MLYSQIEGQTFIAKIDPHHHVQAGQQLDLAFDLNYALFFDPDSELRIEDE